MLVAQEFIQSLKSRSFTFFTGIPCSFFQSTINYVIADRDLEYVMTANEGTALALAAGAALSNRPSVVLIQNSGLGNLINPLTSLNMIYRIPVLLFISGRAYGVDDEPQHEVIGRTMGVLLDVLKIKHQDLADNLKDFDDQLERAVQYIKEEKMPFVFFVRKGTVVSHAVTSPQTGAYCMTRMDAIRSIGSMLTQKDVVIATTGHTSRELFSVCDRQQNFYMQGSMGHAASFAMGVAMNQKDKRVVVLDGDGSLLMHMGSLSAIGHYKPRNYYHILLDNESYETTGNQSTTSATTDFSAIAKASGYLICEEALTLEALKDKFARILNSKGPAFLRVKINSLPAEGIPRISTKYSSEAIADNFRTSLLKV